MKTYSKAELTEQAQTHFENLGVSKLFATSDGQFFVVENRARLHAGAEGNVYVILSAEAADAAANSLSLLTTKMRVDLATTPQELQEILLVETGGANRSEVLAMVEGRIAELYTAPITNHGEEVATALNAALRGQPDAKPLVTEPTAAQKEAAAVAAAPATAPQEPTPPATKPAEPKEETAKPAETKAEPKAETAKATEPKAEPAKPAETKAEPKTEAKPDGKKKADPKTDTKK